MADIINSINSIPIEYSSLSKSKFEEAVHKAGKFQDTTLMEQFNKFEKNSIEELNALKAHSTVSNGPGDLLKAQMHLHEISVRFYLAAKLTSKATQGIETILKNQ